jgi:hypothetical protein
LFRPYIYLTEQRSFDITDARILLDKKLNVVGIHPCFKFVVGSSPSLKLAVSPYFEIPDDMIAPCECNKSTVNTGFMVFLDFNNNVNFSFSCRS